MSEYATDCRLEKLKSGVYELSWIMRETGEPDKLKAFFKTKQQLMVMANHPGTLRDLKSFLQEQFRTGEVIK